MSGPGLSALKDGGDWADGMKVDHEDGELMTMDPHGAGTSVAPRKKDAVPSQRSSRQQDAGGRHGRRGGSPESTRGRTGRSSPPAQDLLAELLREVALLREQVTTSADLYGAYRDAALERARRVSELLAQVQAHERALLEARAREDESLARARELEATVRRVVDIKRAAETRVEQLKHVSRADAERARRAEALLRAERASHARTRAQQSSHLARRSVRLCRWLLDRPAMRAVVRVLSAPRRDR